MKINQKLVSTKGGAMANERDKVAIFFGALGITFVNAVPLWGIFGPWFITMSWGPTQRLTTIPIVVFSVLSLEFMGGKLLSKGKIVNGRFVYLGKILAYGAMLSALVPILLTLLLLLPHLSYLLYLSARCC